MKEQNREHTAGSRLFSRTRLSALGILAMAAMAQAVITAKVTISTYSAFASQNAGATPGMLIFPRASKNDYNEAAGSQWLTINGNGTYTTTLGAAGYYWTGFNNNNAYQASNCTVTGLPAIYLSGTYLADGTTVNMTITCTEPDVTGPVFSSAAVSSTGTSLTITFNEGVDQESYATTSAFSVTAGGTAIGVSNVAYSGSTAVLTLSSPIASGKAVLVSYTGSGIYDGSDNAASNFSNKSVTNNSTVLAPTVTTGAATSITSTTASLAGTVKANSSTTTDSIQYGSSTTYGTTIVASPATTTGTAATAISASLSGLLPGTTYHYRTKAVNAAGTTFGADFTFTTGKLAQSISATTAYSGSYGDTVALSATASSGLVITWTSADSATVKIVSGSKAVLGKTGKALIVASQVGNASYDSAASAVCTLTVDRKFLRIVGTTASDKIYDGTTAAAISGAKLDSVLAGDSVALVLGTATFASKDVGTSIGVSFASFALAGKDSASYQIHTAGQPFLTASILTKTLLVKALDTAKIVGTSDPVLAYTDTGLVTGDALTGALARAPGDTVGHYAIGQGTLTAGSNYALAFVPGTFVIRSNPTTAIEGNNPMRIRTLGTLGASAFRKLPAMASGPAAPTLGLNSVASEAQSLSLLLPAPATVSVDIFDLLGVPVISWNAKIDEATWKGLQEAEGGRVATISWNLRAENGTAVPAGVYLWKVKATTADGQQLETVKRMGVK